jgi:tRNA(adenine34) deaminase
MFHTKTDFMNMALQQARSAFQMGEVPVGAIIVDPSSKRIVAEAHNLVERLKDPTAHAEMLAIRSATSSLKSKNLSGLDIYITLQPCLMCVQAVFYSRISRIYFGAYDYDNHMTCHKHIEIYGGIYEQECSDLLLEFFKIKRKNGINGY